MASGVWDCAMGGGGEAELWKTPPTLTRLLYVLRRDGVPDRVVMLLYILYGVLHANCTPEAGERVCNVRVKQWKQWPGGCQSRLTVLFDVKYSRE